MSVDASYRIDREDHGFVDAPRYYAVFKRRITGRWRVVFACDESELRDLERAIVDYTGEQRTAP